MTAMAGTQRPPRRLTGRMVLAILLGFFFVVTAVNMVFVFYALDTFPGLNTADSYREGLRYNDELAAAREQEKLGWASKLDYGAGTISVRLTEKGQPVGYARVTLKLMRPATAAADRTLVLTEMGNGVYRAKTDTLGPGLWQAELTAVGRRGEQYRILHEFMVKP